MVAGAGDDFSEASLSEANKRQEPVAKRAVLDGKEVHGWFRAKWLERKERIEREKSLKDGTIDSRRRRLCWSPPVVATTNILTPPS